MATIELTVAEIESRLKLAQTTLVELDSSIRESQRTIAAKLVAGQSVTELEKAIVEKQSEVQRLNILLPALEEMLPDVAKREALASFRSMLQDRLANKQAMVALELEMQPLLDQLKPLQQRHKALIDASNRFMQRTNDMAYEIQRKHGVGTTITLALAKATLSGDESEPA